MRAFLEEVASFAIILAAAFLAAFVVVGILALAVGGCGPTMSPMDAYRIEVAQCHKSGDAEDIRRCLSLVEKKYAHYLGEGSQ